MKTKIDIRRAITERGYTITTFCNKFNLKTQNIIQNYIKGNPTIKRLEDLCEKLNCDITELFYPVEDPVSEKVSNQNLSEPTENETETTTHPDEQPMVNTTAFCPHCGAKVRVGVVLLPE